jgi:chromate transporter
MGLMQAELQDKRQWVPKERFVEGLSLVNMLPGAGATQLGIFLGHARGGWWGGLLAGLCFVVPAFAIMLALTLTYATFGATPLMRGGLYGLGPVVLGIFMVAVYRLGRSAVTTIPQLMMAMTAAAGAAFSSLGTAAILALAAGVGIWLFYPSRVGAVVLGGLVALLAVWHLALWSPSFLVSAYPPASAHPAGPMDLGAFFFKVGALTFGGGLTMIAFIQDQVVHQLQWLTPQEFLDGLALSQFTPGPILMVAAYVGYKVAGITGAMVAAAAIFLPSFILMLSVLPMFERVRTLVWIGAAMKGVGPAVIGVLAVSLVQMAPHALPDPFATVIFVGTLIALLGWRIGVIKLMMAGAGLGVLRSRLLSLLGIRATF